MRNPPCSDLSEQRWMPWAQPVLLKECADPPAPIEKSVVDAGSPPLDPTLVIEMTEDEEGFMVVGQSSDHRPGTDDVGWTPPSTEGEPDAPGDDEGDGDDDGDDGIVIVLSHDLLDRQRPRPAAPPLVREIGAKEVAHG